MNLYASTARGILEAKAARRRRLMEQMAAAALRKARLAQNMSIQRISALVDQTIEPSQLDFLGEPRVNISAGKQIAR